MNKLTPADVDRMRRMRAGGQTDSAIARAFGVAPGTVLYRLGRREGAPATGRSSAPPTPPGWSNPRAPETPAGPDDKGVPVERVHVSGLGDVYRALDGTGRRWLVNDDTGEPIGVERGRVTLSPRESTGLPP